MTSLATSIILFLSFSILSVLLYVAFIMVPRNSVSNKKISDLLAFLCKLAILAAIISTVVAGILYDRELRDSQKGKAMPKERVFNAEVYNYKYALMEYTTGTVYSISNYKSDLELDKEYYLEIDKEKKAKSDWREFIIVELTNELREEIIKSGINHLTPDLKFIIKNYDTS